MIRLIAAAGSPTSILLGKLIGIVLAILFTVACSSIQEGVGDSSVPAEDVSLTRSASGQPESVSSPSSVEGEHTVSPPTPTAEPTVTPPSTILPPPEFSNPVQESYRELAEQWDAELTVVNMENTGHWQYQDGALIHPIALAVAGGQAYLVDSGLVLQIDLSRPEEPRTLLVPGDVVDDVPVLEPLDLTVLGDRLLVLDRAGDVYAYHFATDSWRLDRYDRPVEASSGHYLVALASDQSQVAVDQTRALLETNYKFAELYDQEQERIWRLPEQRAIDLDYGAGDVFILQRDLHEQGGHVTKYRDTGTVSSFAPRIPISQPRQLIAGSDAVYVLDQGGRRLLVLDPDYGQLLRIVQLPQDQPISTAALNPDTGDLILAGQDRLYFVEDPTRRQTIITRSVFDEEVSHDPKLLASLDDFTVPIGGSNITFRDFQLPGAPRHYRLGIHNGIDLYWQPGTKVRAAGDGLVVRADLDYSEPTAAELDTWFQDTRQLGFTSAETLDNYMGRQVWIEHHPGIITRYAHLRSIDPGVTVGSPVSRGQIIGEVGNSGSPASLEDETADAHLHYELWINGSYLGQFMRPIETRDWIERIFPVER